MDPSVTNRGKALRHLAVLLAVPVLVVALATGVTTAVVQTDESPYRISEFPIRVAPDNKSFPGSPVISGKWVIWQDALQDTRRIWGRNLETGQDFSFPTGDIVTWPVAVGGDVVVATELRSPTEPGKFAQEDIFGYRLPDGQRFTTAPLAGGDTLVTRSSVRTDGKTVVWEEGSGGMKKDIYGYDLATQQLFAISTHPAYREFPAVSGNIVVWKDRRNTSTTARETDLYGFDLSTGQEFRITEKPERLWKPAISGNVVVWSAQADSGPFLHIYDLTRRQETVVAQLPADPIIVRYDGQRIDVGRNLIDVDVSGGLVVLGAYGDLDYDIFGYDLTQGKQFIINRAIGSQGGAKISGQTVVWTDCREAAGPSRRCDIYGARLEPGPAPIPPIYGAPEAADAKIEIVWTKGKPVAEADAANIGTRLFLPGTLNLVPCQWNPRVQLWRALNSEPAKLVATEGSLLPFGLPRAGGWDINNVDVSAARDPKNKLYFFLTVDGVPSHSNVWSHGIDARTYFPQQDMPEGLGPVRDAVDAKIEIVWPHDDAPVEQAKLVNISALLFSPGMLLSVPPDFNPTVRLYRALNNDVSQEVAVGQKRFVQRGDLTYPVWDFDNVDVGVANDPANKYYFTLKVDGVTTYTNIWAHGADARTYFPQMDTPTQGCQ